MVTKTHSRAPLWHTPDALKHVKPWAKKKKGWW